MRRPKHHPARQLYCARSNLPDQIRALIELLDGDRRSGFEVRKGAHKATAIEQDPGMQVLSFQLAPHALKRCNIDL
jgi:hypothetical protein